MKKHPLLLLALFLPLAANAGTNFCETVQPGNWSDPATWTGCAGTFPNAISDEALIKTGHTITLSIPSIILQNFTMEAATELNVTIPADITVTTNTFDAELGQINLNSDLLLNTNNNDVRLGLVDGAANLTLTSSGTTWLLDAIGSVTPLQSINTDPAGFTRTHGGQYSIRVDANSDTIINDIYRVGASSRITWEQLGSADIVFNNTVTQHSGSPQRLTVELTGGGDVLFNSEVILGDLTINGIGRALVDANITTRDVGANAGVMTFNVPVIVSNDITFQSENGISNIFFNNGLDDDGNAGTTSIVTIDTPNTVTFNQVGQTNPLDSLNVISASEAIVNANITTAGDQNYTAPVRQTTNAVFTSQTNIDFTGGLNADGFTTQVNQLLPLDPINLTSTNTSRLILGPMGTTQLNQSNYTFGHDLEVQNDIGITTLVELTVNTLTSAGRVGLGGGNALTLNTQTGQSTINGEVNGSFSGFIKGGDGTLTMQSDVSTGGGLVSVQQGTLLINETVSINDLGVVVNAGGVLGGNGKVIDVISMDNGGTLAPGNSPGIFVVGELNTSSTSQFIFEIDGTTAGTEYDQIELNLISPIPLSGTLALSGSYAPLSGDVFTLIDNVTAQPILGTFTGLPEGSTVALGLTISYVGGDGNDVVLTTVCDAVSTVTDAADSGPGTLREAFTNVCEGGVIQFDPSVTFITLDSLINVNKTVTVQGGNTVVSGGFSNRVFDVEVSADLTLNALRVVAGSSGFGAIRNLGQLTVNGSYFGDNASSGDNGFGGGAIINEGTADINDSVFYRNNAFRGGALFNTEGSTLTVTNSTFYQNGNFEATEGGVIHNRGITTFINSTMVDSGDGDVSFGNTLSQFGANAVMHVINTVVSSPSLQDECQIASNSIINMTNSFIDDGTCGATFSGDAMLGTWGDDNHGFVGTAAYFIPPLAGSPLINNGDNAQCPANDQLGTARPQGLTCDIGAIEIVDGIAPEVNLVAMNGNLLNTCDQLPHGTVNTMAVTFSERVLNAEITNNYTLVHAGDDFDFEPLGTRGGNDDIIYEPTMAVSDSDLSNPTVTLTFNQALPDGLVRLYVNDAITDEFLNPLGDGNVYEHQFRIDQNNLLINGHFDDCGQPSLITEGWSYAVIGPPGQNGRGGIPIQFQTGFFDRDDSDHSNSVQVWTHTVGTDYEMSQCTNLVTPDLPIELETTVLLVPNGPPNPDSQTSGPSPAMDITLSCEQWDQADCMGNSITTTSQLFAGLNMVFGSEELKASLGLPDAAAVSVECRINMTPTEMDVLDTFIDGVKLEQQDVIFIDGFEATAPDLPTAQRHNL